jgi:hypothetical protein
MNSAVGQQLWKWRPVSGVLAEVLGAIVLTVLDVAAVVGVATWDSARPTGSCTPGRQVGWCTAREMLVVTSTADLPMPPQMGAGTRLSRTVHEAAQAVWAPTNSSGPSHA